MRAELHDAELIAAFEAGTLDPHIFSHRVHLRVAWLYVTSRPLTDVVQGFSNSLKSWTKAIGLEGKHHETITWFFMLLISERQAVQRTATFDAFIGANPDLIAKDPSILSCYYKPETLASEHARKHYVLPDNLDAQAA